jgi:hypothetical protein
VEDLAPVVVLPLLAGLEVLVVEEVVLVQEAQEILPQHHRHKEQMVALVYHPPQVFLAVEAEVLVEIQKLPQLQLEQVMVVQEQSLQFLEHQSLMLAAVAVVCIFLVELLVLPDLAAAVLVLLEALLMQLGIPLGKDLQTPVAVEEVLVVEEDLETERVVLVVPVSSSSLTQPNK